MRRLCGLCVAAVWCVAGSGCALDSLRAANQRLKDSNERLVAENNRLEAELAAAGRGRQAPSPVTLQPEPEELATHANPGTDRRSLAADLLVGEENVSVAETSQGLRITIDDRVFFAPGQVKLASSGKRILGKVARLINYTYPGHVVRVDGHTDDTPVRKVRKIYPTNWELSTARACTVVRYLVDEENVSASRIYPAGFAYYRPLEGGRTTGARQKNRRVEITILNESA